MESQYVELRAMLLARAYVYELFHKAAAGRPTEELGAALGARAASDALDEFVREGNGLEGLAAFLASMAAHSQPFCHEWAARAQDEYDRLVTGFGKPRLPLWEVAYTAGDGSLFGTNTFSLREAYHRGGWASRGEGRLPEDSLGLLMDYLARSAAADYRDVSEGCFGPAEERLAAEAAFVGTHVDSWVPRAAARARAAEAAMFYGPLLEGIVAFAKADAAFAGEARFWCARAAQEGFAPDGTVGDEAAAALASVEESLARLREVRLPFLEENELVTLA